MDYEPKTLNDYLAMLRRRRITLLASIVSITLIGVYVAYAIPAMYQSTSQFLIEQQEIPQDVVQSTVNTFVDEQIQAVRTRVMSSGNLADLREKHDLYPDVVATGGLQSAIDKIRANTLLETEVFDVMNPRSGRPMMATISFTLSFDHADPQTARDVAVDLANLYLSENMASRTGQVEQTIDFIRGDIERYENEVEDYGLQLAEFKSRNLGSLPEQMNSTLQTIERTERSISTIKQQIRDSRARKLDLSAQLARATPAQTAFDSDGNPVFNPTEQLAQLQLEKMRLLSVYSPEHPDVVQIQKEIDILRRAGGDDSGFVATLAAQVEQARVTLQENLQRYSPDHPDVVRSRRTLESLEAELSAARANARRAPASSLSDDPYTRQLQISVRDEDRNIREYEGQIAELESKLADLEANISMSPTVAREYEVLRRQNERALANVNEAREKLDEAMKAQKLESGGSGDRFTIIEPARVPAEPYKPNRTAIILLAAVLALGVGLVLAMILDTLDDTVKGARDMIRLIDTPPIAVIPYLETEVETRQRAMTNGVMVATVVGAGVLAYLITLMA